MSDGDPRLILTGGPAVKRPVDTPAIMRHVLYAVTPAIGASIYYFGLSAVLLIGACVLGALGTEWLTNRGLPPEASSIRDYSAVVTGTLLALTLPPGLPLWMAVLGGVVAVGLGKLIFGGLGQNIFNPSLVGRAFLQASFPVAMTTWVPLTKWSAGISIQGSNLALPFIKAKLDAVTAATPLAMMKFEHSSSSMLDLLLGSTGGSLGETSAVLLLLGGLYLGWRKFLNWRIPVSIFASVAVFGLLVYLIAPAKYPTPHFHLFSGGLMLGAIFMATDPVTSPITQRGCWVFGAGIGVLVVLIRVFGGLPEGVMFSILLMNGVVPLINRVTQARIYGAARRAG